jgi:glycosyltransferase involved in cell wall biosynthesis
VSARRPKIVLLGFRGFPNVKGGVEKHVESLAPLLLERGFEVEAIGRRPYLPDPVTPYRGVRIIPVWTHRQKSLEAILHTFLGVFVARWRGADLLHIHAIGPALMTPLARLLGLRVVVTHHGYDYDRGKWNRFAKAVLRAGESAGMRCANGRIAVSRDVARAMAERHGVPVRFVPNGVDVRQKPDTRTALERFGLSAGGYILTVGRLVPEKRQLDLIAAFARLGRPDVKLVIVGSSDHPDDYVRQVEASAAAVPGVVMAGFQTGTALGELFAHARLFVLPSSHEGMPIALLEALGYGLPVLASDIVANREVGLAGEDYFPLGDVAALAEGLRRKLAEPPDPTEAAARIAAVGRDYAWDSVADETAALYREVLAGRREAPAPEQVGAAD